MLTKAAPIIYLLSFLIGIAIIFPRERRSPEKYYIPLFKIFDYYIVKLYIGLYILLLVAGYRNGVSNDGLTFVWNVIFPYSDTIRTHLGSMVDLLGLLQVLAGLTFFASIFTKEGKNTVVNVVATIAALLWVVSATLFVILSTIR